MPKAVWIEGAWTPEQDAAILPDDMPDFVFLCTFRMHKDAEYPHVMPFDSNALPSYMRSIAAIYTHQNRPAPRWFWRKITAPRSVPPHLEKVWPDDSR